MGTHSSSGSHDASLTIEPSVGGRIYERAPDGREFEWGHVKVWAPPEQLLCEWLVGETVTELEVRFLAQRDGATVVEIEHRGWERFDEAAKDRRDMNDRGWSSVIPVFVRACTS
jgi:hypothetical protein